MEVLAVIILLSVLATLAITSFQKNAERAKYNNARMNVIAINTAAKIYEAQNGAFNTYKDLSGINQFFGLKIVDSDFNYTFDSQASYSAHTISAGRKNGQYTINFSNSNPISDTNPSCSGTCP